VLKILTLSLNFRKGVFQLFFKFCIFGQKLCQENFPTAQTAQNFGEKATAPTPRGHDASGTPGGSIILGRSLRSLVASH